MDDNIGHEGHNCSRSADSHPALTCWLLRMRTLPAPMTMPNTLAMAVAALACVVWLKGRMDCPRICMTRVMDTVCVPEAKPLAEALAEPEPLLAAGAAEGATAEAAKEEDNAAVGSTLQGRAGRGEVRTWMRVWEVRLPAVRAALW